MSTPGAGITRLGSYPTVEKRENEVGNYMGVGAIILWIILFTFIWILIVSFAPSWCCHECDDGDRDLRVNFARAALYAFIISLIILIIIAAMYSLGRPPRC